MTLLTLSLKQTLGEFALNADLEMPHRVTGIFGRSGSGKTSLLRAIAGLSRPDTGTIEIGGISVFDEPGQINLPVHQRRIGTVFQESRLFPHLTVAQNLDFAARYLDAPPAKTERDNLIDVLGLGGLLGRRPGALSGGEMSRVALGRAVLSKPQLLLMDEPFAALDWARKSEIISYLRALLAQTEIPVLFVSHDMDELVQLAGGLAIMRSGRVLVSGLTDDVLSDPTNVPLIGPRDAGSVLSGTLKAHSDDGLSQVALHSGLIWVPKIAAPLGAHVRLRLRAQDVMLSVVRPKGLSAQTVLKTHITQIVQGQGPGIAVGLAAGPDRLIARITARALSELKLVQGQTVWAVLKATATSETALSTS